jgi:hypothetical protein
MHSVYDAVWEQPLKESRYDVRTSVGWEVRLQLASGVGMFVEAAITNNVVWTIEDELVLDPARGGGLFHEAG